MPSRKKSGIRKSRFTPLPFFIFYSEAPRCNNCGASLFLIEDTDTALPYNVSFTVEEFAMLLLERFGGDDHLFMANYYRPVLQQSLQEVLPLLYTQAEIDSISNSEVKHIETDDFLENWNWNNFWEYFSWVGLHTTTEFTQQIGSNPSINELYEAYYMMSKSFGSNLPD